MKRILPALCALTLLLALTACNQQGSADNKIGVVDETVAFQKNDATNKAMAFLQKKGEAMQAEARKAYEAMQKDNNEETVAAYKEAMGKLQQAMGMEQQRIFGLLNDAFTKVIDEYRTEKGFSIILPKQSTLSMDDSVDVTEEVTERMNKIDIDFTKKAEVKSNGDDEQQDKTQTEAEGETDTEAEAK